MDTEDNVIHEVEGEMVWPSSSAEDHSRAFLASERAKYSPVKKNSPMFLSWGGLLEKARWVFEFFFLPCISNTEFRSRNESQNAQSDVVAEPLIAEGQVVKVEADELSSASSQDERIDEASDNPVDNAAATITTATSYVSTTEVIMGCKHTDTTGNDESEERGEIEAADDETERYEDCQTDVPEVIVTEADADVTNEEVITQRDELTQNELVAKEDGSERDEAGQETDTSASTTIILVQQEYETHDREVVEIMETRQEYDDEYILTSEDLNKTDESSQQNAEDENITEGVEAENDFEEELAEMKVQYADMAKEESTSAETDDSVNIILMTKEEDVSKDEADNNVLDESAESDKIEVETSTAVEEEQEEASGISESQMKEEIDRAESDVIVQDLEIASETEKDGDADVEVASEEQKEEKTESTPAGLNIPIISVTDVTESGESLDKATESASTTDDKSSRGEGGSLSSSSLRSKKDDKLMKVDNNTKRIFKRKVKSYVKQIIKSKDLPSFSKNNEEGAVITPTVCHVGTENKTSLTLKKTELSGSKSSSLGRLSSSKEDEFVRLVALVGFEGYGKTTLMKRYADMASGRVINVNELVETGMKRWHPFARKDFFKFVHYIDLRDLPTEGEYTADELLFQILIKDMTPKEAEGGYRWLNMYKKSILFIIDSVNDLDMFPEEVKRHIGYSEKASPQTIMYNLLTGNILPKAHVLISSNITNTSHLGEVLSPDRVYVQSGFDRNDIKTYLAKNAKVLNLLTDGGYDNLYASSKVPLGMFYSSTALSDDEYRLDALLSTITHYVRTAVKGKKQGNAESSEILNKLKKLSFRCSLEDVEVVYENIPSMSLSLNDLENCRLFVAKTVGRIGADDTMRWIKTFTYGHITLREYLSVLHLGEADMDAFIKFTKEDFALARFDFQQKSLYGLLFSNANLEYAKDVVTVSHLEEKRNILRQLLLDRLQEHPPSFYLYTIVHESPDGIDDIVKENLRTLSIVGDKLTTVSMFVLSCVASRVGSLNELELRKCYPSDDSLSRFLSSANHDETTVKILNLRENPGILTCGASVREICQNCKVEELDFGMCNFHGDVLAALPRILRDIELKVFRIDDNPEISENSLYGIGEFIKKGNVKGIGIGNTDLNEAKLQRFERSVKNYQFDSLDIQRNREVGSQKVMSIAGSIASECKIQNLNMAFCGVMSKHCESLKESLKTHQLKKLDISALEPINVSLEDLDNISRLLPCIEEELRMENWQFSSEALTIFTEKVESSGLENVKIFYGSKNECISKVQATSKIGFEQKAV